MVVASSLMAPLNRKIYGSIAVLNMIMIIGRGGSFQDKLASDQALKLCVEKVGQPEVAALMLAGVRVGGSAYLPTQFRWGYGWPYPRLYGDLSKVEQEQVKKHQRQLHEIIID